ncbi:MAG TPA: hypothetical protein VEL28_21785 [Candidatus Binatia bacterium]|nr:hypothetical protein [Candidatus Binatia bacterium]
MKSKALFEDALKTTPVTRAGTNLTPAPTPPWTLSRECDVANVIFSQGWCA